MSSPAMKIVRLTVVSRLAMEFTYRSLGNNQSETILFIHTLFSSSKEWDSTALSIMDMSWKKMGKPYHILLPSLQIHQISNLDNCLVSLSNLIVTKAKYQKAHIVGLGIGAHLAIHLAWRYPQLVKTVNGSGFVGFPKMIEPLLPYGIYIAQNYNVLFTKKSSLSLAECRGVADILLSSKNVFGLPMRALIIVGLRRVLFGQPADSSTVAKNFASVFTGRTQVKGGLCMGHCWNRDHPETYAAMVLTSINNRPWAAKLKKEFIDL
jgi:pimeloyl-ACP methyl ester carboxylesterase